MFRKDLCSKVRPTVIGNPVQLLLLRPSLLGGVSPYFTRKRLLIMTPSSSTTSYRQKTCLGAIFPRRSQSWMHS